MHEAQMHEANCFVTLTYDDQHLVNRHGLNYRDFQLFMKRLRKKFTGQKVRFYMCGEYGETFSRPHFHACLFGIDFPDKEPISKLASQAKLYNSATLTTLWPHGYSSVGAVTFQSAAYVARYVMKKITGDRATAHYTVIDEHGEIHQKTPEFCHMSLKPGIGHSWLQRYHSDVYPSDQVIAQGHPSKPPRYYDKQLNKTDPALLAEIKTQREFKQYPHRGDNTDQRLRAKELVTLAKTNQLKRTIS